MVCIYFNNIDFLIKLDAFSSLKSISTDLPFADLYNFLPSSSNFA